MKLAVFKDHGVGRYFAQLFDDIPGTTFYLSEKNKSGLDITPHAKVILREGDQARHMMRHPLQAWRRHRQNDGDRKRDYYYFALRQALEAKAFDVAITGSERSLYTLASLKAEGFPLKLVYWTPFTIPFVDMFAERSFVIREFAFPWVDSFVAITETCRQTLLLEGIAPERVTHIYPGIDLKAFRPAASRDRPANDFHILFVGKLTSWKGCYTLLYAAKLLLPAMPGLRITFVGRGAQQAGLTEAARLLGLGDRICFKGFVDYEKMPSFYSDADVFVLPSLPSLTLAEQFGFVVAEAMACGLPAVVARVGGLPEVVGREPDLIFTPGDHGELAARMLALQQNPDRRRALGAFCLAHAQRHYDARINGRQLESHLGRLLGEAADGV